MKHLHDKRILHRDIKAQNIFLGDQCKDNIKVGDLGLGRMLGPDTVMAETGVGTPLYFSPELCRDEPYNHKSDIWALGILFYELTALELPFVASNQAALALKILQDEPGPLPGHYSAEMRFLILKMLEKDMDHRPTVDDILAYNAVRSRIDRAKARELQSRLADQYAELEEDLRGEYEAKMDELEHAAIDLDIMRDGVERTPTTPARITMHRGALGGGAAVRTILSLSHAGRASHCTAGTGTGTPINAAAGNVAGDDDLSDTSLALEALSLSRYVHI